MRSDESPTDVVLDAVRDAMRQRTATYGAKASQRLGTAQGRAIRAIIETYFDIELPSDIPPSVVHLIFASRKLIRAAKPGHRPDDRTDLIGYAVLSELEAQRESNNRSRE